LKGYLLDTSIVLIAMTTPERLSLPAKAAMEYGLNVVSVISYWEVALKVLKGKLSGVGDPAVWWKTAVSDFAATVLPLRPDHIGELSSLPSIHQDPFDRMLIAQATFENLTLITTDGEILKYAGARFRAIA
jgi:PIN domain nuclease of toxin-antitoxin system